MIHVQAKRYQVVLWENEDRLSGNPALRMDFDDLDEARSAFQEQRERGDYRAGVLMEWHKSSSIWNLLEQYP